MGNGKFLDLDPKLIHGNLTNQMAEVFGEGLDQDPLEANRHLQMVGREVAKEYLTQLGLDPDLSVLLDSEQNSQRRRMEFLPNADDIDADLIELNLNDETEIGLIFRPKFFDRFRQMIRAARKNELEEPIDRLLAVQAGYVFLHTLAYSKQLARRLDWQSRHVEMNEVLDNILETGLRSYFQDFLTIDDNAVQDYRETAVMPRLAAYVTYSHAQAIIVGLNMEISTTTDCGAAMLENRYQAAALAIYHGIAPSQADIGMAKPFTNSEAARVVKGLNLLSRQLSDAASGSN